MIFLSLKSQELFIGPLVFILRAFLSALCLFFFFITPIFCCCPLAHVCSSGNNQPLVTGPGCHHERQRQCVYTAFWNWHGGLGNVEALRWVFVQLHIRCCANIWGVWHVKQMKFNCCYSLLFLEVNALSQSLGWQWVLMPALGLLVPPAVIVCMGEEPKACPQVTSSRRAATGCTQASRSRPGHLLCQFPGLCSSHEGKGQTCKLVKRA